MLGLGLGLGLSRATLPSFTPKSPSSQPLELWLDATDNASIHLTSSKVDTWGDKSGNARDYTQSIAGSRPVLATNINSKQTIFWDGIDDYLSGATWALTAAEVFIVKKQNIPESLGQDYGQWRFGTGGGSFGTFELTPFTDSHNYDGFGSTVRRDTGAQTTDTFFTNAGVYNVITTSSEWTLNINGVQIFTTGTNTVGWCAAGFLLGATDNPASPSHFYFGDFGEVIVYGGKLSTDDRAAVMDYLRAKWGTP